MSRHSCDLESIHWAGFGGPHSVGRRSIGLAHLFGKSTLSHIFFKVERTPADMPRTPWGALAAPLTRRCYVLLANRGTNRE